VSWMSKTHEQGDVSMVTSGPFLRVDSDGQGKVEKKVNNRLYRYDRFFLVTVGIDRLSAVTVGIERFQSVEDEGQTL